VFLRILYYNEFTEDDGSFTFPSNFINNFAQTDARLTVSRGVYKESTHNNKSYLFIIGTSKTIDFQFE